MEESEHQEKIGFRLFFLCVCVTRPDRRGIPLTLLPDILRQKHNEYKSN